MKVFHQLKEIVGNAASSVAMGNFDGCHLGHTALLKGMVAYGQAHQLTTTVLTFYPHPVEVLNPGKKLERLTSGLEKLGLLEQLGVETVVVLPFDTKLSDLSPRDFFEQYLLKGLHAKSIHVGYDFKFGKARSGNLEMLKSLCDEGRVWLQVQPPFELNGQKVSSSRIRQLLQTGEINEAAKMLGRPYTVSGQVSRGDQRGVQLGYPTANLRIPAEKCLPKNGVYVTDAYWQKQKYRTVTNVGVRPTFHAEAPAPTVEVHFLDFNARLYDEFVELEFLEKIRNEIRFDSVDELKEQIGKDVLTAREFGEG
jgi:riboflavin kinase/FMN adenylyltransferase